MILENTAPELPLIIARPSVVVGHTKLGCLPSASIFWWHRTCELLRRTTCTMETYDDVIPMDYVARALLFLLFKPTLHHRRYHISGGTQCSVTWKEISSALAEHYGERPEEPYKIVDFETLKSERVRITSLLGPGNQDYLLMALEFFFRFAETNVEIFDNSHLLEEGMPSPPKFTDYIHLCATMPSGVSVYEQMRDDE